MFDFANRTVMVTGASGNLGSVLSRAFQASGAKLALVDRGEDRLRQIYSDLVDLPDYLLVPILPSLSII